jgi:hypothetical protein
MRKSLDLIHRIDVRLAALGAIAVLACSGNGATNAQIVPPPPPSATDPVLQTSLDGPSDVISPTFGTGLRAIVATNPANDFVSARIARGLRANAVGERALYPQSDAGAANVELEHGTMDFWYQPNYDHNDNLKYTIAGTGTWTSPGALHFGKHNNSNQNAIFLIFYNGNGVRFEHNVAVSDYSWKAGEWLQIRITWDFNVAAGQQNLHLYLNGRELPLSGQVSRGPQPVPAEKPSELIYIGCRDTSGDIPANGVYDDFRIWNRVIAP